MLSYIALLALAPASPAVVAKATYQEVVDRPIRIGRTPSLSPDGKQVCFSYQGNLWVVSSDGGVATRLTANDSVDLYPKWSPDGKWIAFNSDREGGNQVFIIPAVGGAARQITFHSGGATVGSWYPDGKSLAVSAVRIDRRPSVYKLDIASSRMKKLFTDEVKQLWPVVSPDGKWIAFTRGALVDTIREGYHGAANYDIYVGPSDGSAAPKKVSDSEKNDMWAVWGNDSKTLYYSSERGGTGTIWKQSREGGKPAQVVTNPPDCVRWLSSSLNGEAITYESDNQICVNKTAGGVAKPIEIICRTDERGPKANYATYNGTSVSEYKISNDGKRAAFVIRGDIFVVNIAKGGEAKRLTDSPSRDWQLEWAPDGKSLVFVSNRTGSNKLYSINLASLETTALTKGDGDEGQPEYSSDGKWIAFSRAPLTKLLVIKPDGTGEQVINDGPKVEDAKWSPDNKWLTYVKEDDIRNVDVWVTAIGDDGKPGQSINITDHPGYNFNPEFTGDGKFIVFRTNRYRNRDIETINHQGRFSVARVPLEKEPEKFEEDEDLVPPKPPAKPDEQKKVEVKIDPDEIHLRAQLFIGFEETVNNLSVAPDGKSVLFTSATMGQADTWMMPVEGGSLTRLNLGPIGNIQWAPDSSKFYFLSGGGIRSAARSGAPGAPVSFTARMEIDRLVDYQAVFDEAWATWNSTFYDKTFRGQDWKAIGQRYRKMIDYVTIRSDFNYLMTQMLGELNASHTGFGGGPAGRPVRPMSYLGIYHDEDYSGPGVKVESVIKRSPAAKKESELKAGEYILQIDGKDVSGGASYDQAMTDKSGRQVSLLVNSTPSKTGARTVKIKPIGSLQNLLYEKWIDERRDITDKASGGKLGYLHVAAMGDQERNRFERELFSIGMRKDGMVLDFRGNNGGDTHDSLLRILSRNKHYFSMAPRTETPFPQPEKAYTKPVIVLMDEASLSDAEVFANGFREYKLGKIVGKPTMGWIIFTSGTGLVDGSFIRLPYIACYTLDGRDMELWGVPPDIDVELTPADVREGRDTQLLRAVQELMKK